MALEIYRFTDKFIDLLMMTIKKKTATKSKISYSALDKHWHLARDDSEIQLAELEYALYRVYAGNQTVLQLWPIFL